VDSNKDIVGISIADDGISLRFGTLTSLEMPPTISELGIRFDSDLDDNAQPKIHIKQGTNPQDLFDSLISNIFDHFPKIKSIGVGCYGPFNEKSTVIGVRDSFELVSYSELEETAKYRYLSKINLREVIQNSLDKCGKGNVCFCIETDVAVDSLGYIHEFQHPSIVRERTAALIRADNGLGGTFMHMNDNNAWHGVSHTEVGQINVQPWSGEEYLRLYRSVYSMATNPYSIEGLASIPAIEHYFDATFETLKKDPSHIVWDRQAWYLAQLAWVFTCFVAPTSIVFCGNIMSVPGLLKKVREKFKDIKGEGKSLPYYPQLDEDSYIDGHLIKDREKGGVEVKSPANRGTLCLAAMTWLIQTPSSS